MENLGHLIAELQAFDKKLDSLTLKKASEDAGAIGGTQHCSFSKTAIALGYFDQRSKRFVDSPASLQFQKAYKVFNGRVSGEIIREAAFWEQAGRASVYQREALSAAAKTIPSLVTLMKECRVGIAKTIALLKAI